ncbi:MAG: tetratricopeptide repeat protein [Rubrivivax sp.]
MLALCLALGLLCPAAWADEVQDIERLLRSGQAEQALTQVDAAIAQQPRAAALRFLKGVVLSDLNRPGQAIEVFVLLTQDFPELPDPYNNLAVLYAAEGRLDLALTALQQALRNDPQHLAARENLGDVHLALAVQAWDAARAQGAAITPSTRTPGNVDNAALLRKLRLARQILAVPATATAQRAPG